MSCPRGCCATYREHLTSVVISSGPSEVAQRETRLSRDLDAYKRLVESGGKPRGIDGSAELERGAETHHEVANRNIITDKRTRDTVTRAFAETVPTLTPVEAS